MPDCARDILHEVFARPRRSSPRLVRQRARVFFVDSLRRACGGRTVWEPTGRRIVGGGYYRRS